jgi:hypothetical protein
MPAITDAGLGQPGVGAGLGLHPVLDLQLLALALEGLDHEDVGRAPAAAAQAADQRAGHVAAADECDGVGVHRASVRRPIAGIMQKPHGEPQKIRRRRAYSRAPPAHAHEARRSHRSQETP